MEKAEKKDAKEGKKKVKRNTKPKINKEKEEKGVVDVRKLLRRTEKEVIN